MHVPDPPSDDEIRARLRRAAGQPRPNPIEPALDPDEAQIQHLEEELGRLDGSASTEGHRRRLLPEHDPEFAARLEQLETRASQARAARENAQKSKRREYAKGRQDAQSLGIGMAIIYAFLGFPLIGVGIGVLVGHYTHSTTALSLCGFGGVVAGCVCALVLVKWSDRKP